MQIGTPGEGDREIQILSIANTNSITTYYKYLQIQMHDKQYADRDTR